MTEQIEAKIEKLLRMADGTANENESALALQMAQKLADLHNLDIGNIGKSGARADERVNKGLYQYQRTLYAAMADMNHCKAWITKGTVKGSKYSVRILGSRVNVAVTKNLCDYVEAVANRLVKDEFEPREFFTKNAHHYREGVIDRMVERIKDRRAEEERDRLRQKREQEARAQHPGAATENAIVLISDVAREEAKANYDYEHGEGAWDRSEARGLARRQEMAEADAKYKQWELDHPEEVARQAAENAKAAAKWGREYERKQRAAEKRRQERIDRYGYDPKDYRAKATKYDSSAYWQGQDAGAKVGIDDQIDAQQRRKIA